MLRFEIGVRAELADRLRTLVAPPVGVDGPGGSLSGVLAAVPARVVAGSAAPRGLRPRGAVATGSADPAVDPHRAEVWGLGRVVGLEHPDRGGGLIDLPEHLVVRAGGRLVAVLAGGLGDETEV
ncbi:hypothetical protein, partial [Streptomyces sp. BE303]|uniref:hypothetical protein n=1 Tax=Streptomyces sp. BE303 TaxID=3002528 RepID=UPI002E78BBC8